MYSHFYALNERVLRHFITEVRDIAEGPKARMWPFLFDAIGAFQPRPRMRLSGSRERPYTEVSYHTGPALGWQDFERDTVPEWSDPRLAWILRLVVLESADYVMVGRDARFNAVFCSWLEDQKVVVGETELELYDDWRKKVFLSSGAVPAEFWFLESEAHRAYLAPAVVAEFSRRERDVGLFRAIAGRLSGSQYGELVASELLRIRQFFELVEVEQGAIYYLEGAT